MAKPNYIPGVGALATNRYDFQNHIEGFAFRHNAVQIDVNPAVIINGHPYITVADALNAISTFVTQTDGNGQGFISVGDGYDTYHNANGNPNYDPTIPALDTILNPIFTSIINYYNNPNASNLAAIQTPYLRIKDGGIVLIKSGTYIIKNTVIVPPGISIIGENFGTKIVNQTSPQAPLFNILPDVSLTVGTRITDKGVDATGNLFMFARSTGIFNLVIADNFVEPIYSGDISYRIPQNTVQPLIILNEGANFYCSNVKFVGKTSYSGGNVVAVTSMPIGLNSAIPSTTGTNLNITGCMIDGFAEATQFNVIGSAINSYFTFKNNQVRVYGLYGQRGKTTIALGSNGQSLPQGTINVASTSGFPTSGTILIGISGAFQIVTYTNTTLTSFTGCLGGSGILATNDIVLNISDNCFLNLNSCNIDASSNNCYGNKNNVSTFVYLYKGASDAILYNYPIINITNNDTIVDRAAGSTNFTFLYISNDSSLFNITIPKFSSFTYNNSNSDTASLATSINSSDSSPQFLLTESAITVGSTINSFTFDSPVIISVTSTPSTPGSLTIIGQTTTQATTAGGAITVQGGNGNSAQGGDILIQGGSGTTYGDIELFGNNIDLTPVSSFVFNNVGSVNTQSRIINYYTAVLTTTNTIATQIFSFHLPTNNTIALMEISYIARQTGTFNSYGAEYNIAFDNNAGTVTVHNMTSGTNTYAWGAATSLSFSAVGTNCIVSAIGLSSTNLDWQAFIKVMVN